jgi:inosine-uridine nucleoside N-ribohydrolase
MERVSRLSRRDFLRRASSYAALASGLPALIHSGRAALPTFRARPTILCTDIGDDIDDTWALGLLLKSPELDLKLLVGDYGKRQYRAKLLAKLLQAMGRSKVPIGLGMDIEPRGEGPQAAWVKDYDLSSYPGKVHQNGVQAIVDTVMKSREPVTIISIGPMPNLASALEVDPRIARNASLVGMYGSVRKGYGGSKTPSPEWNVKADAHSCQKAFTAPWPITITPLDTCGLVTLNGSLYQQVLMSGDRVASTIIENYKIWSQANKEPAEVAKTHSSTLFDTVAVYLAYSRAFCTIERLGIKVTGSGMTLIDPGAKQMDVATDWKSLEGYEQFLVKRLIG